MKRLFIFIFVFAVNFIAMSQNGNLQNLNKTAAQFYKNKNYQKAASVYESMLSGGKRSANIFYNLGNSYYKNGEIGKAILNYERALKVKPGYSDARFNLMLAQTKIQDQQYVQNDVIFVKWLNNFNVLMSSNSWAVFSIILFILCLGLFLLYIFANQIKTRKQGFVGFLVVLCLCVLCICMSYRQKKLIQDNSNAILIKPEVTLLSTPDVQGTRLFELHEGVKIHVKSTLDSWVEIETPDGKVGWLKDECISRI